LFWKKLHLYNILKSYLVVFLFVELSFAQLTGILTGKIVDKNTQIPLVGVNIQILNTGIGTPTDDDGYFYLEGIPIGTNHIKMTIIGYENRIFLNVPITTARPLYLGVELVVSPVKLDEIEVPGKMFSKSSESIISSININQLEFRSDPGSAWDVQRVIQPLPSVTQVGDHLNEFIVRGGNPGENLFLIDDIDIQNPNHYGIEGYGGGGLSVINPFFVKNVEFTPGAFSARFGDKASSVMNISLKDGSRSSNEFDFDVSMGGASLTAEGPLKKGKGSFIIGSTWSYLDLINTGLTALPDYNNHQVRIIYDINPKNKLIMNGLYANSNNTAVPTGNVLKSYFGVPSINHVGKIFLSGISLKTLLGEFGYGLTTFSYVQNITKQDILDFSISEYPWFTRNNWIGEGTLKTEWFLQPSFGEISTGISIKRIDYDHNEWLNAKIYYKYDTSYWITNEWHLPDSLSEPEILYPINFRPTLRTKDYSKYLKLGYYLQSKLKILEKLELTSGIRLDYFTGTDRMVYSPRINLKFTQNPANAIHIAYGRHYQYPEYFLLLKDNSNLKLKTKYTDQLVLGLEHFFDIDFRATLELYYKYYNNIYTHYYWSHEPESFPDQLNHIFHWENEGSRKNYGLELLLQKKLSKNWYGIFSYSWNNSLAKDERTMKQIPEIYTYLNDGNWYPWDYDIRHKITINGGWKKKFSDYNWYQELKNNVVFKVLSPIIPISDEIELSLRYSFTSGKPFTDKTYYPELYDWKYPENTYWNNSRLPNYSRLDFMVLKRHHLKKMNIVMYLNFVNIFNRDNILTWVYNINGTKETVLHFKTLPIGGITIEL